MGKKDKAKKRGLGKAKTLEKTAKKEAKRAQKAKAQSGEKDVEELLEEIVAKEMAELAIEEDTNTGPPSARVNFVISPCPTRDSDIIIHGGEKFDGNKTNFFADLFRYSLDKNVWTRYRSKNQPPPRSSHAIATHKSFVYIFGGEFSSPRQTQFYHYRDLWRLDTSDFSWEKLDIRGGPTARSGHRMTVSKDRLFVFGGFYDTITDVRYLNDLYMIDLSLDELKWTKIEVTGQMPSPRSGFCWTSVGEEILLYGGYCKEKVKEAKQMSHKDKKRLANSGKDAVPEDATVSRGIVHSEVWKFDPEVRRWEKLKRPGYGPSNRSGFGMVLFKNQLIVFGGVEDEETEESISSTFYNDIFAYNVVRRKWYPMTLRKKRGGARRRRRRAKADKDGTANGAATGDAEEAEPESKAKEEEKEGEANEDIDEEEEEEDDDDDDEEEELVEEDDSKPVGRFNSGVVLLKSSRLVVYGGMYEKGDQEITLDDLWTLDLNKLDEFTNVKPLSEKKQDWNASESDASADEKSEEDADEDEDKDEDEDNGDGGEEDSDDEDTREKRGQRQSRRSTLQNRLGAEDDSWTPRVGETLKEFFERTKLHWMQEVYEATEETGKANRRVSFQWAKQRFEEIKPTLKELEELEEFFRAEQEAEERHEKKEADLRRLKNRG
mmetsp:Transcript_12328/g.37591  ORF Transcript_12328/g.37591 Transcript_12328/m.37591 type:complete len:662 (-) Transcript_12328:1131-3116(-)